MHAKTAPIWYGERHDKCKIKINIFSAASKKLQLHYAKDFGRITLYYSGTQNSLMALLIIHNIGEVSLKQLQIVMDCVLCIFLFWFKFYYVSDRQQLMY